MTSDQENRRPAQAILLIEQIVIISLTLGLTLIPAQAHALQPLAEFLSHAAERNFDNREARATAVQRVHEASQAWARLLPSLTLQGDYIRNQYLGATNIPTGAPPVNGVLPTDHIVITPLNQWDASFVAALSLIDVAAWDNIGAGAATREAQQAREAATALEVQKTVARTYYQLIGARRGGARGSAHLGRRRGQRSLHRDACWRRSGVGAGPEAGDRGGGTGLPGNLRRSREVVHLCSPEVVHPRAVEQQS